MESSLRTQSASSKAQRSNKRTIASITANTVVYAIGLVNELEITVIYTDIDVDERRIISAWRAEPHERRHYWESIGGKHE